MDNPDLQNLAQLALNANQSNIGDSFTEAIKLRTTIGESNEVIEADFYMAILLKLARDAEIGWKVFASAPATSNPLSDFEATQLIGMLGTLHELMYCYERVNEASVITWSQSTPVRLYVNSIFHYVSALFLLDWKQNKTQGFPSPGTAIKALFPLGLENLLDPVYQILNSPFGTTTFGETIRRVRNGQFVHGTFSYDDIKQIASETSIHDIGQKFIFNLYQFRLFEQIVIIKLKIISVLTAAEVDVDQLTRDFISQL